jgi:hypothetical protein
MKEPPTRATGRPRKTLSDRTVLIGAAALMMAFAGFFTWAKLAGRARGLANTWVWIGLHVVLAALCVIVAWRRPRRRPPPP